MHMPEPMEGAQRLATARGEARRFLPALRLYARAADDRAALPVSFAERLAFGIAQPIVGIRTLLRNGELLKMGLLPPLLLGAFCLALGFLAPAGGRWGIVKRFYGAFATLAPLPSIVFAKHYARLAARSRVLLDLGDCEPRLEGVGRSLKRMIHQFVLLSIAPVVLVLPIAVLLLILKNLVGGPEVIYRTAWLVYATFGLVWALHWIVVDALDGGQVLEPGQTLAEADAKSRSAPTPWFVRAVHRIEPSLLSRKKLGISKKRGKGLAGFCEKYSMLFREEIAFIEQHRAIALGFGLATAALLALPIIDLFFRPIIVVAAVHVVGSLERAR
jgi:hypothetical protein